MMAPATSGPTTRAPFTATAFSASARGQLVARHELGKDRRVHRPAHREPDAVGEDEREQHRRGQEPGDANGVDAPRRWSAIQNCVTMK